MSAAEPILAFPATRIGPSVKEEFALELWSIIGTPPLGSPCFFYLRAACMLSWPAPTQMIPGCDGLTTNAADRGDVFVLSCTMSMRGDRRISTVNTYAPTPFMHVIVGGPL